MGNDISKNNSNNTITMDDYLSIKRGQFGTVVTMQELATLTQKCVEFCKLNVKFNVTFYLNAELSIFFSVDINPISQCIFGSFNGNKHSDYVENFDEFIIDAVNLSYGYMNTRYHFNDIVPVSITVSKCD